MPLLRFVCTPLELLYHLLFSRNNSGHLMHYSVYGIPSCSPRVKLVCEGKGKYPFRY